jgi:hypothetical protein
MHEHSDTGEPIMLRQFTYRVKIDSPLGTHTLIVRASDTDLAGAAALAHLEKRNTLRHPLRITGVDFR